MHWKWQEDLKEEQVLVLSESVKRKDVFQLLCQLDEVRVKQPLPTKATTLTLVN